MPIVLDGTQGISTPMYAGSISSNAVTPVIGMKNKIINGACVIDQRNAGASTNNAGSVTTYSLDRWAYYGPSSSKFSIVQSSTAPAGFVNSLLITSLAATSMSASNQYLLRQAIEGYNIADLNWGSANAKTVTLSFWVRSSLTGAFGGSVTNGDVNRSYPFSYTISTADTWEQKTVTITGPTNGTWNTTNGPGLRLYFALGFGSDYNGTANAWATVSDVTYPTGSTNILGTNGATFYITGVQLEVGSTATSFDYRSLQQELFLCERYFRKSYDLNTAVGTATRNGYLNWNYQNLSNYGTVPIIFGQRMRAAPTSTNYNPDLTNTVGGRYWNGSAEVAFTGSMNGWTNYESNIQFNKDSTNSTNMLIHWTASAEL